jgi:mRNA-degrading endonuclease RelE of RelBE toxin-antitoxin system
MRYEIVLSSQAVEDLMRLSAYHRSMVRDAIEIHLRYEPDRMGRSCIKRLRGIRRPQFCLRVDEFRIYYDISECEVEILAVVSKSEATDWLKIIGEKNETSSIIRG